jgi:uncharacterized protein YodC (DUF2158 family)
MQKFQPGAAVKHKGAGQLMTVFSYKTEYREVKEPVKGPFIGVTKRVSKEVVTDIVICNWVDASGQPHQKEFHQDELEPA